MSILSGSYFSLLGGFEKHLIVVTPANAGVPKLLKPLDSCLEGMTAVGSASPSCGYCEPKAWQSPR